MRALGLRFDRMLGAGTALAALSALAHVAAAEPLSPDVCETLRRELAELEAGPAAEHAARGPAWAKDNLSPEQIKVVAHLISVREGVLFRCRRMLVEIDTPPAEIDPEKIPLPVRNSVFEAAAAANPPPPAAVVPAAVQPASTTTSASPPLPVERPR